MIKRRYLISTR